MLYKIIGTLGFLVAEASEVQHSFILKVPWGGLTLFANNISYLLVGLWLLSIVGIWQNRDSVFKPAQVLGVLLLAAHCLILSIGNNYGYVLTYGLCFLVAAFGSIASQRQHVSQVKKVERLPPSLGAGVTV